MPGTNKILEFCATDTGTNLLSDTAYAADAQRPIGNQPGVARSVLNNKVLRQASVIAAALAQYIADRQGNDITDALTPAAIEGYLETALESVLLPKAGGNMSGGINETMTTVASAATPDIWTNTGNVINYAGTTTTTGFAAAPQAGARRWLVCSGAVQFTNGANLLVPGGANYTVSAGDIVMVVALTITQFRLIIFKADGTLVVGVLETGTWPGTVKVADTIYQNTSGRKRRVTIQYSHYFNTAGGQVAYFEVGSTNPPTLRLALFGISDNAIAQGTTEYGTITEEVPSGWYYRMRNVQGTISINGWSELDE